MNTPAVAYLGLGSNLGDRLKFLRRALVELDNSPDVRIDRESGVASVYESAAVGGGDGQELYLNTALRIATRQTPVALLRTIAAVEHALGRTRTRRWGPRVIDVDILLYESQTLRTDTLVIPHPRLHVRAFVLEPLAEIAGDVVHPVLGVSIAALALRYRESDGTQGGAIRLYGPGEWSPVNANAR